MRVGTDNKLAILEWGSWHLLRLPPNPDLVFRNLEGKEVIQYVSERIKDTVVIEPFFEFLMYNQRLHNLPKRHMKETIGHMFKYHMWYLKMMLHDCYWFMHLSCCILNHYFRMICLA